MLVLRDGSLGRIRLNRPKALNSLTLAMVRAVVAALQDFEQDKYIAAVLVDGMGERGLCAGGDIRAIYESGKSQDGQAEIFFREEYAMNARIACYTKPYIAFMDGITMGGGVGISAHGSHRIVTERTRMAMPETGIGFFPDVGATWLLAKAPGEAGIYLGLTGAGIGGADAVYAGFADVLVDSGRLPEIASKLSALPPGADNAGVRAVIDEFAARMEAPLAAQSGLINKVMAGNDVAGILRGLEAEGSEFALATAATLREKSPTSLVLTLALLRLGKNSASLQECLDREYDGAKRILKGTEFYEGVRAAIIDKDRKPRWNPASIAALNSAVLLKEYSLA